MWQIGNREPLRSSVSDLYMLPGTMYGASVSRRIRRGEGDGAVANERMTAAVFWFVEYVITPNRVDNGGGVSSQS